MRRAAAPGVSRTDFVFCKGKAVDSGNESLGTPPEERRQRLDLRVIFDDVVACVEPFCHRNDGALEYWAAQAVREAYPDLDAQGLRIIVGAALRVCRARVGTMTG